MKQGVYKVIYFLLVISFILSYSISFASLGTYLKFSLMILASTYIFNKNINIRKYIPLLFLFVPFLLVPFILIILGRYKYLLTEQVTNSLSYIIMIFAVLSFAELFVNKKQFFSLTCLGVLIPVIGVSAAHAEEINFNVQQLFINIVNNDRLDRAYLGFSNPNILGLVLLIALLCFMYFIIFYRKYRIHNVFLAFLCIFLLLNTGSRTSIIAAFATFVIYLYLICLKKLNKYTRAVCYCSISIAIIVFIILNDMSVDFSYLNLLTSGRILRQLATINFLKNTNRLFFGLGNLNSGALYSGRLPISNDLDTDNSPVFFITTVGLIGLIFVLITLLLIYFNIPSNALFYKSLFFCWIITSLFENTLFIPSSLVSLFFLLALQNIKSVDEKKKMKNLIFRRKYL